MAQGGGCVCRFFVAVAAIAVVALLILAGIQYKHPTPPRYYASIVSLSGISVDDWGRQPVQFNLTLGVKSRSPLWRRGACLERGTAVQVAYHSFKLAYGTTGGRELCASGWDLGTVRSLDVVTLPRSNVSGLPEFVVEGLVADALHWNQVFDVTVRIPSTGRHGDKGKLVSCTSRKVGDNTKPCDVHYYP